MVTVRGLLEHKLRLALTAIAIVLGVTFITGTFILTDTLHATFTKLFSNVYQNIDFQVRGVAQFSNTQGTVQRNPIPDTLLSSVRRVPGVESASGEVSGIAQFIAPDGKAISNGGAPTLGVSFDPDRQISELRLVEGHPPTGPHDVVMDAATAKKYGFHDGDRVQILLPGPTQTFTITGIARFGTTDNLAGATLAAFDLPTAQAILGHPGTTFTAIDVVTQPGADKPAVQRAIAATLPRGVQVVTGQTVVQEATTAINAVLGVFSVGLLVFAFIALFVGAFTILNTFSIIVGQRTKELALLRIVGASRRQVFRAVLGEAALVGLGASIIGIVLGVVAAVGLEALLRGFGIDLPSGPPVFKERTVVVALVVGVGVTVVAAISPARRAVRISPVAAISEQEAEGDLPLRSRFAWGGSVAVLGIAALAVGLTQPSIQLVGLGAVGLFVGVAMLSPALARPLASAIGRPFAALFGVSGKLGRENAMRNPRRTAQTAAALMVGLALVSAISVFGASLSRSATASIQQALSADLIVTNSSPGGTGRFSTTVPATVSSVPGVTAATTVYGGPFEFLHTLHTLRGLTTAHLTTTVIFNMTTGSVDSLDTGALLIDTATASSDHLAVGDRVPVKFALTGPTTLRIGGIFKPNALIGSFVVSAAAFAPHFTEPRPVAVLLGTNGSPTVETAVRHALAPFPNVQVQSRAQYVQTQAAQIDKLLGLVYALLALAVVIALIGIVNTLLLSVLERTHELGLLRAVGMKRRQVRAMIRCESVILAIFGTLIGLVIGTALGVALVSSLRSQGLTQTVVPIPSLIAFLILAALLGLVAAGWPARRAARLDVLSAIAFE